MAPANRPRTAVPKMAILPATAKASAHQQQGVFHRGGARFVPPEMQQPFHARGFLLGLVPFPMVQEGWVSSVSTGNIFDHRAFPGAVSQPDLGSLDSLMIRKTICCNALGRLAPFLAHGEGDHLVDRGLDGRVMDQLSQNLGLEVEKIVAHRLDDLRRLEVRRNS